MPKKKSERQQKLSAIENTVEEIRDITAYANRATCSELVDLDIKLARALDAVEWLRQYPDSLLEPLAALEHDQFHSWCQIYLSQFNQETRDKLMPGLQSYVFVPDCFKINARAWAQVVIEIFETGITPDLRRRETRSRRHRLSDKDVVRLRWRRSDGETLKELAKAFNVSQSTVSYLASGKRRASAGGPLTVGRKG